MQNRPKASFCLLSLHLTWPPTLKQAHSCKKTLQQIQPLEVSLPVYKDSELLTVSVTFAHFLGMWRAPSVLNGTRFAELCLDFSFSHFGVSVLISQSDFKHLKAFSVSWQYKWHLGQSPLLLVFRDWFSHSSGWPWTPDLSDSTMASCQSKTCFSLQSRVLVSTVCLKGS